MPRSRRRHHSRSASRSRSRSHSHDRDREPKRRKIDNYEITHHKRSVSSEPEANDQAKIEIIQDDTVVSINQATICDKTDVDCSKEDAPTEAIKAETDTANKIMETQQTNTTDKDKSIESSDDNNKSGDESNNIEIVNTSDAKQIDEIEEIDKIDEDSKDKTIESSDDNNKSEDEAMETNNESSSSENTSKIENIDDKLVSSVAAIKSSSLIITPKKAMSPKQIQKKMESEKKRLEKQKEREERERKRQEEKDEKKRALEKIRQEKEDLKQKEKDLKLKEKELKDKEREMKKKEREEKDEVKRKEKEMKQQEVDEKNREKQKKEEQKQKIAAAFVNFFVPKKISDDKKKDEPESSCIFIPFQIKPDMRLPPLCRKILTEQDKHHLTTCLEAQNTTITYLTELGQGKTILKSGKTFPYDDPVDDCLIIDLGETIEEQKPKLKMKAKYLKFQENQRPAYYGTWRKRSKLITPKQPLVMDKEILNYENDSDDEWEDEVDGESIVGSDAEEKGNESENDDEYEVDNEFFVPHLYLSDDEREDEERMNPEALKAQLKVMKNQFEEERKLKIKKIKPRLIGCIWYDKKVDEEIDRYLQPLSIISNNTIIIKKRDDPIFKTKKRERKGLEKEYIPEFLQLIHGNTNKKNIIINEFIEHLIKKNVTISAKKIGISRQLKQLAQWIKCPAEGPMHNKFCWYVGEEVAKEYSVELELPNKWTYVSK